MFNIDDKELKQYKKNLENLSKNAYPKVVRSTLDRLAYLGLKAYKKNIKTNFVIRNANSNIILKSIRYEKCSNTLDISKMQAHIGQLETTFGKKTEQLRMQEFGEFIVAPGKHIFKPTKAARGGKYKKPVQNNNLLSGLETSKIEQLTKYPASNSEEQFKQAVAIAKKQQQKVYLITNKSKSSIRGLAEIDGTKSSEKGEEISKYLYSIKDKTQRLKKVEVLAPVGEEVGAKFYDVFKYECKRRMERELAKSLKKG